MNLLLAALRPFHLQRSFAMTTLRQRMLEDMSIRNLSENTKLTYLQQVSSYSKYFERSPTQLGPQEVRDYQVYLTMERKLSAASIGIVTAALRFLYKITLKQNWQSDDIPMPKKPFKLPVVLSTEEVTHFLSSIENYKHRAMLMTAYATGMRVSEVIHLRVSFNFHINRVIIVNFNYQGFHHVQNRARGRSCR